MYRATVCPREAHSPAANQIALGERGDFVADNFGKWPRGLTSEVSICKTSVAGGSEMRIVPHLEKQRQSIAKLLGNSRNPSKLLFSCGGRFFLSGKKILFLFLRVVFKR